MFPTNRVVLISLNSTAKPSHYYSYFTDLTLEKGDRVVIDAQGQLIVGKVAKVRGLTQNQQGRATKWVVQKVDFTAYDKRRKEAELVQELENRMESRLKQQQKYVLFNQLAETDPEMKELVEQLRAVNPNLIPATKSTVGLVDKESDDEDLQGR